MSENIVNKTCSICNQTKPISEFYKNKKSFLGRCKSCQISKVKSNQPKPLGVRRCGKESQEYRIWSLKHNSVRLSARRRNIEFQLTIGDVKQIYSTSSEPCPYCKQQIEKASVERIDNRLGYTLENCILVCSNCNRLKKDATPEQIRAIYFQIFGDKKPSDIM